MSPDALLGAIRDADAHRGGLRCMRVFRVDRGLARALRDEVLGLVEAERGSDVLAPEHVTHWTRPRGEVRQFSLLNRNGDFADFRHDHDFSCLGKRFHHGLRYPRLAAFVGAFRHLINFRIGWLGPGAELGLHEEHSLFVSASGTAAVRARFHLPLQTSPGARMMLDEWHLRFSPRWVYYFNQGCVHGARNPGPVPRVHLIWDQLLTEEACSQMFYGRDVPAGLVQTARSEWMAPVRGRIAPKGYARLPPLVTPLEAQRVSLCAVQ